jgi:hypothetical protein
MDVRNRGRPPWPPWGGSLVRPSDRIEAVVLAVLVAAGLAVLGLGVWAGHAMGEALAQPGPRTQAGEYVATAVATGDAWPVTGPGSDGLPLWRVSVTWPTPSGLAGGSVLVDLPVTAGEPVPVVVDGDGRPRAEQLGLAGAPVAVGLVTVLAGWLLLASLWLATGSMLARRHAAALDLEWKRVEPPWSGRSK